MTRRWKVGDHAITVGGRFPHINAGARVVIIAHNPAYGEGYLPYLVERTDGQWFIGRVNGVWGPHRWVRIGPENLRAPDDDSDAIPAGVCTEAHHG